MKKSFIIWMMALGVIGLSCTEERTIVRPADTESVHLQGVLYGWRCDVDDMDNNPWDPSSRLFSSFTGESAKITLIRDNGFTSWFETDDSSRFDRYISAGTYQIVIETGYTWPPITIPNIHLRPGDTLLELDIVYRVTDPEKIIFYFKYPTINDTVGLGLELETMVMLNGLAHVTGVPGPLAILKTTPIEQLLACRSLFSMYGGMGFYVIYDLSIIREYGHGFECWNVVQAYEALQQQLDMDTTGVFNNLSIVLRGSYPCLD